MRSYIGALLRLLALVLPLTGCGDWFGGGVVVGGGADAPAAGSQQAAEAAPFTVLALGVAESVTTVAGQGVITAATIVCDQILVRLMHEQQGQDQLLWQGPFRIDLVHQTIYPQPVTVMLNRGWRIRQIQLLGAESVSGHWQGRLDGGAVLDLQSSVDLAYITPSQILVTQKSGLQVGLSWQTELFFSQLRESYPEGFASGITQITSSNSPQAVDALRTTIGYGGQAVEQ